MKNFFTKDLHEIILWKYSNIRYFSIITQFCERESNANLFLVIWRMKIQFPKLSIFKLEEIYSL